MQYSQAIVQETNVHHMIHLEKENLGSQEGGWKFYKEIDLILWLPSPNITQRAHLGSVTHPGLIIYGR